MLRSLLILILTSSFGAGYGQVSDTLGSSQRPVFSYKTANPKAKKLMKEDFFWNPLAETGPFGIGKQGTLSFPGC